MSFQNQTQTNNISLYVPRVYPNIAESRIKSVFDTLSIGKVSSIDFIKKQDEKNVKYYEIFIHFAYWYDNIIAHNFQKKVLESADGAKLVYDDPWYWIVFENKSNKTNKNKNKNTCEPFQFQPTTGFPFPFYQEDVSTKNVEPFPFQANKDLRPGMLDVIRMTNGLLSLQKNIRHQEHKSEAESDVEDEQLLKDCFNQNFCEEDEEEEAIQISKTNRDYFKTIQEENAKLKIELQDIITENYYVTQELYRLESEKRNLMDELQAQFCENDKLMEQLNKLTSEL